ncbi:MAG: thiamine pyrophosphate-binding protein [Chitinophagia bacterium]|nr:thiamine pyrophosphate-binding protein [Chitinophagia bacterium]
MIKVTDYIVKRLEEYGIQHVFMVTGGGAMHLNDSFGKSQQIQCICNHHEQASAIAAEGYARMKQSLAVVNVTTGPGGLNTLNGVLGQWTDSVPVLYISGQVRYDTTVANYPGSQLRQLGDQEVDIVRVVSPLTKYATTITQPDHIVAELDKAIDIAISGRPGPVWIDVPMNIQGATFDETTAPAYIPAKDTATTSNINDSIQSLNELLAAASRPVIVAGHGIRLGQSIETFQRIATTLSIPILSTLNGFDINETESDLYIGTIGSIGSRAGNFALQNADLVIYLGTRNNIRQISYNYASVARAARKVAVDIDAAELSKPFMKYDLAIHADLKDFLTAWEQHMQPDPAKLEWWRNWCLERKRRYPAVLESYKNLSDCINPYHFMEQLTLQLPDNATVVTGDATACICYFQAGRVRPGQRVIWNSGCASMGYDLPAAIGAATASGEDVICLAGDGSLQMNIQELMTVVHHQFPIKLFYLNNDGYISMKQTQDNFFGKRIGADSPSGVSFPQIEKLAFAYGIPYQKIDSGDEADSKIQLVLNMKGPVICEVILPSQYAFAPKLSSERKPDGRLVTKPMEDMFPFLDREEFLENMIIDPINE